jgi:hypothetical protein
MTDVALQLPENKFLYFVENRFALTTIEYHSYGYLINFIEAGDF